VFLSLTAVNLAVHAYAGAPQGRRAACGRLVDPGRIYSGCIIYAGWWGRSLFRSRQWTCGPRLRGRAGGPAGRNSRPSR